MDWTAGYVSEVEYTHGYYRELSPGLLSLACLSAGFLPPAMNPLCYLELGFGQGLSLNIHAASVQGEFWGTDFNPNQAAYASSLAKISGADLKIFNDSFAEFAGRNDLPDFDVICLHGIWTWISNENRQIVVDLLRRKLRVGGLAYVSYNCLPGWAPAMPLRHLMSMHAEFAGSDAAGLIGKVDGAVAFAQQVIDSGAIYFKANPAVSERLKKLSAMNKNYLAHEYFNSHWEVMPFSEVAKMLGEAKLAFMTSANMLDHVDAVNISESTRKFINEVRHPILQQSVRDYFINQQFRKDIFVKGSQRLSPFERSDRFSNLLFALTTPPNDIPMKVVGALGEATLQEKIYKPVIEIFADDDFKAKSLNDLANRAAMKQHQPSQIREVLLVLAGAGHLHPAQEQTKDLTERCLRLNRRLYEKARDSDEAAYLACPALGSAIKVDRLHQLFLLAMQHGQSSCKEQAVFASNALFQQNQRILKDGKPIEALDDTINELVLRSENFAQDRLPMLKALGVVA